MLQNMNYIQNLLLFQINYNFLLQCCHFLHNFSFVIVSLFILTSTCYHVAQTISSPYRMTQVSGARVNIIGLAPQLLVVEPPILPLCYSDSSAADCPLSSPQFSRLFFSKFPKRATNVFNFLGKYHTKFYYKLIVNDKIFVYTLIIN